MSRGFQENLPIVNGAADMGRQVNPYPLLYSLGVTANYIGFFHTAYAVELCAQRPDRLLLVTKWLYPEVAKEYQTTWKAVERNIRRVGCVIWRENRPLLERLARRNLAQKPCAAKLLAILTSSLLLPSPDALAVHVLCEPVTFAIESAAEAR